MTEPALTAEELDAFAELEQKAMPAPWTDKGGDAFGVIVNDQCLLATSYMLAPNSVHFRFDADREIVVAARNIAPRLVAQVKADAELIAELKGLIAQVGSSQFSIYANGVTVQINKDLWAALAKVEGRKQNDYT